MFSHQYANRELTYFVIISSGSSRTEAISVSKDPPFIFGPCCLTLRFQENRYFLEDPFILVRNFSFKVTLPAWGSKGSSGIKVHHYLNTVITFTRVQPYFSEAMKVQYIPIKVKANNDACLLCVSPRSFIDSQSIKPTSYDIKVLVAWPRSSKIILEPAIENQAFISIKHLFSCSILYSTSEFIFLCYGFC